jgi:hypothetical protein
MEVPIFKQTPKGLVIAYPIIFQRWAIWKSDSWTASGKVGKIDVQFLSREKLRAGIYCLLMLY